MFVNKCEVFDDTLEGENEVGVLALLFVSQKRLQKPKSTFQHFFAMPAIWVVFSEIKS